MVQIGGEDLSGFMEQADVVVSTTGESGDISEQDAVAVEEAVVQKTNVGPENVSVSTNDGNVTVNVEDAPSIESLHAIGEAAETAVKTRTSTEVTETAIQKG